MRFIFVIMQFWVLLHGKLGYCSNYFICSCGFFGREAAISAYLRLDRVSSLLWISLLVVYITAKAAQLKRSTLNFTLEMNGSKISGAEFAFILHIPSGNPSSAPVYN